MSEYVTVLGDTIQGIAERNGHPGEGRAIRDANPELEVEGDTPQPGTVLNIPWNGPEPPAELAPSAEELEPPAEEIRRVNAWEAAHPA